MPAPIGTNIFHLLVILPLLLYIGYQKCAAPDWSFNVLFGLALLGVVMHLILLRQKLE